MRFLIVSSVDPVFAAIARHLSGLISVKHEVKVVEECASVSILKILKQRIRRAGILTGLSQFLFKVFDVLFLRKEVTKNALAIVSGSRNDQIKSVNSSDFRILASRFDVVICIATTIVEQETLRAAKYGFINVHPGILPQYRGTGNLWAVVNEDWKNIGCTCHWMTRQIDVGRVITITKIKPDFDSLWEMNYRAMLMGVDDLSVVINEGSILEKESHIDESKACYYSWYGFHDYLRYVCALKQKRGK